MVMHRDKSAASADYAQLRTEDAEVCAIVPQLVKELNDIQRDGAVVPHKGRLACLGVGYIELPRVRD